MSDNEEDQSALGVEENSFSIFAKNNMSENINFFNKNNNNNNDIKE